MSYAEMLTEGLTTEAKGKGKGWKNRQGAHDKLLSLGYRPEPGSSRYKHAKSGKYGRIIDHGKDWAIEVDIDRPAGSGKVLYEVSQRGRDYLDAKRHARKGERGRVSYGDQEIDAGLMKKAVAALRKGGGSVTVSGLKKRTYMKMERAGLVTSKGNTFTLTAKGRKVLRINEHIEGDEDLIAEMIVESKAWQQGLSDFSPIAPGSGGSSSYGGAGDAGPGGDTPGMTTNQQTAAQAAAVGEASRVFQGIYQGAFPGKRLTVRGQSYEVTTGVTRGPNRDWLSMCNRKGEQFMLMLPAKGPNGELNAGHLTLMQVGRARTDPYDITVAALVKENEEFFAAALAEGGEPFGFDRLDAITEGKISSWLDKEWLDYDAKHHAQRGVPSLRLMQQRLNSHFRDQIDAVGKKLLGKQFYQDSTGAKINQTYVGHRGGDGKDDAERKKNRQEGEKKLAAAIERLGHKVKWGKDGRISVVVFDPRAFKELEQYRPTFEKKLMAKVEGVEFDGELLHEGYDYKSMMSKEMAKKAGISNVANIAGGVVEPGSLVKNSSGNIGIFLGHNPKAGTVHVIWSDHGQFSAANLIAAAKKLKG